MKLINRVVHKCDAHRRHVTPMMGCASVSVNFRKMLHCLICTRQIELSCVSYNWPFRLNQHLCTKLYQLTLQPTIMSLMASIHTHHVVHCLQTAHIIRNKQMDEMPLCICSNITIAIVMAIIIDHALRVPLQVNNGAIDQV